VLPTAVSPDLTQPLSLAAHFLTDSATQLDASVIGWAVLKQHLMQRPPMTASPVPGVLTLRVRWLCHTLALLLTDETRGDAATSGIYAFAGSWIISSVFVFAAW
jgi:hypothetical protein